MQTKRREDKSKAAEATCERSKRQRCRSCELHRLIVVSFLFTVSVDAISVMKHPLGHGHT